MPATVEPYATVEELARLLKVNATTFEDQLTEVLTAAAGEINAELDIADDDDLAGWELSLAAEVNLERAEEHWHQRTNAQFGLLGLDSEMPVRIGRDTWERYALKLAPLKRQWGLA